MSAVENSRWRIRDEWNDNGTTRGSVLVFIDTQRTRKLRPFYNFSRCSLADDAVRKNVLETLKCHLARVMHPTQQSFRRPQTRCTSSASAFYHAFHTRTSYRS